VNEIARQLERVRERIALAAESAGRAREVIRLIAVSKKKPVSLVREAYAAGQRDFGENYVQELLSKAEACADLPELRWHMIGHLQRNKVRQVLRAAAVIHTVDSERLAAELGRRATEIELTPRRLDPDDPRLQVLVEVNLGGETQKSGCAPEQVAAVLEAIEREPALKLAGLMTMPPFDADPAAALPYFTELARLRQRHGGSARLPELSMGMTLDLEQAIRAGATMVRIGTAIFGARDED
jgi:hypothetical protein